MLNVETATRADLEVAILEHGILPCDTKDQLEAVSAMGLEELRDAVREWVRADPEEMGP